MYFLKNKVSVTVKIKKMHFVEIIEFSFYIKIMEHTRRNESMCQQTFY